MAESLDRSLRAACLVAAGASALPLLVQMPMALAAVMMVTAALGAWSSRQWPAVLRVFLAIMIGGRVLPPTISALAAIPPAPACWRC